MSHYDSIMFSPKVRLLATIILIALLVLAVMAFNLTSIIHAMAAVYPHGSPTPLGHMIAAFYPHGNPVPNAIYPHG